jgi:hypothetical protein
MGYFTLRNTAIMALAQVVVIVIGVLAAGACHKWYTAFGKPASPNVLPPQVVELASEYGLLALVVPAAWMAFAVCALRRADADESQAPIVIAFLLGLLVLLLLLIGIWFTSVQPWFRLWFSFD